MVGAPNVPDDIDKISVECAAVSRRAGADAGKGTKTRFLRVQVELRVVGGIAKESSVGKMPV